MGTANQQRGAMVRLTLPVVGAMGLVVQGMRMPIGVNEEVICAGGRCEGGAAPYERFADAQPGYQWDDAGGYCGSWSVQRATMARGAYISQQQVRDATSPGGGHDNEILSTNIAEALNHLKLKFHAFDFENEPLPQLPAYFKWLKSQLAGGNPVAWMILWNTQKNPIYNLTAPAGMYGHVEPVIGIQSQHPLDDTRVYDDDVVVHFTDAGTSRGYRNLTSMQGSWGGPGQPADCGDYGYCMGPYGFGWAIHGFQDPNDATYIPTALHIEPEDEPDTRSGLKPIKLVGTLHISELTVKSYYDVYRWDHTADAFTYTTEYKMGTFQALKTTFSITDKVPFMSDGTTYYRVIPSRSL